MDPDIPAMDMAPANAKTRQSLSAAKRRHRKSMGGCWDIMTTAYKKSLESPVTAQKKYGNWVKDVIVTLHSDLYPDLRRATNEVFKEFAQRSDELRAEKAVEQNKKKIASKKGKK